MSGVITALLPAKGADAPLTSDAPANTRLVAPVPYAGSNGSAGTAQALNWGTVGPQRQSADTGYTYTALPPPPPRCRRLAAWTQAGLRMPPSSVIR